MPTVYISFIDSSDIKIYQKDNGTWSLTDTITGADTAHTPDAGASRDYTQSSLQALYDISLAAPLAAPYDIFLGDTLQSLYDISLSVDLQTLYDISLAAPLAALYDIFFGDTLIAIYDINFIPRFRVQCVGDNYYVVEVRFEDKKYEEQSVGDQYVAEEIIINP